MRFLQSKLKRIERSRRDEERKTNEPPAEVETGTGRGYYIVMEQSYCVSAQ